MRMSGTFTITAGILSTMLICGCNSMFPKEEKVPKKPVYDAKKHIEQLQNQVNEIRQTAETNKQTIVANKKILENLKAKKAEESESQDDKMVEAAVLLAKNWPNSSIRQNAIRILGALGGPKAEAALIGMLKSTSRQSYKRDILQALNNMHSLKLHGIIVKMLKDGNPYDSDALRSILSSNNFRGMITKKDIPLLISFYQKMPKTNNNRYQRRDLLRQIARIAPSQAVDLLCEELVLTTQGNYKRELLYAVNNHEIAIPYASWKKIFECLGPVSNCNYDAYRIVMDRFRNSADWRFTDLVLPLVEFAPVNKFFGRSLISCLSQMRDPKAAPALVKLLKMKEFKDQNVSNFPGIVKIKNEYQLANAAEMEKLMSLRQKRMEQLAKFEKMRKNIK